MADPYYYHHQVHHPPPPPPSYYPYLSQPPPHPPPGATALPPQYYHHPPPPPPELYYNHHIPPPIIPNNYSQSNDVKTLFVAGLPDDVKPREIHNLFKDFPGFQSSQLRSAGTRKAFAFAVFTDQQSAVTAMQSLNGLAFDLEQETSLAIELAKSNSKAKRSITDNDEPYPPDKKYKGNDEYSRSYYDPGVGSNSHFPGAHNIHGYPSTQSQMMCDYGTANPDKLSMPSTNSSQVSNTCTTLFVANLGPACTENELTEVFSRCPGFTKLKMQKKAGLPVAFVDFKSVASSSGALKLLQGTLLPSSVEGMRLEYAKSPMGQKARDRKR